MTGTPELLDPDRVRQLFDLASNVQGWNGGNFTCRPVPGLARDCGSRQPCTREPSTRCRGSSEDLIFHGLPYPDRPHFSAFSWAACDAAYRESGDVRLVCRGGRPRGR